MNNTEIASFKDLPEAIRKELDSNGGHEKLTADEIEMQEVIEDAFKEMRLFDGFQLPQIKQIWLRKNIMEHLAKKYGEPVITKDLVQKHQMIIFHMVTELLQRKTVLINMREIGLWDILLGKEELNILEGNYMMVNINKV